MTEGIPACGAPARLRPKDVVLAHDHLFAIWLRLHQIACQHDDEAARILAEHERFTVRQAIDAWRQVNRKLIEAVHRLEWVEAMFRSQRERFLALLEPSTSEEDDRTT